MLTYQPFEIILYTRGQNEKLCVHKNIIEWGLMEMNTANPIKDEKQLKELITVYPDGSKNQMLILYCLYTGLRISDVITAKAQEAMAGRRILSEQKTGKRKIVTLNPKLINALHVYVADNNLNPDDYLFFSNKDKSDHIKRSRASKIIAEAGNMIGITVSAHSLRKTFGYMAYKNGTPIELLMNIFNHSSQSVTLRYIGITQDNINQVYNSIDIGF